MENKTEVSFNLTEIVRNEVREAVKALLAQTLQTESIIVKSGDFTNNTREAPKPQIPDLGDTTQVVPQNKKNNDNVYQLPVKVARKDGSVQFRRKKRTQGEMKEAVSNAMPLVVAKHPSWSERRLRRLAKNLVRRYKVNA